MKTVKSDGIKGKSKAIKSASFPKGKTAKIVATKLAVFKKQAKSAQIPPGMMKTPSGIFIPNNMIHPVPASKLKKGFETAKTEIKGMIDEVASSVMGDYNIKEIELEVSFNADGKFLGFGVGGSSTIKIKISPV